jgi:hypothetical protein
LYKASQSDRLAAVAGSEYDYQQEAMNIESEWWEALSDEDKQPFVDAAAAEKAVYVDAMRATGSPAWAGFDLRAADEAATAPPMGYASPHDAAAAQRELTRALLHRGHPGMDLSDAAWDMLCTLQDRLAHYLLLRAYRGENVPPYPQATPLPEHHVGMRFPSAVAAALPNLCAGATSAQASYKRL